MLTTEDVQPKGADAEEGIRPRWTPKKARAPAVAGATMQQHTRPEPQPLAEFDNALEPNAADESRDE